MPLLSTGPVPIAKFDLEFTTVKREAHRPGRPDRGFWHCVPTSAKNLRSAPWSEKSTFLIPRRPPPEKRLGA